MKKNLTLLVFAALSAIALYAGPGARLANAAPGDIFNLGTLSGSSSGGTAINDAGQVTGDSNLSGDIFNSAHAFRYDGTPGSGGVMHDLGTPGGTESHGLGINSAGQVAGWFDPTARPYKAFRYDGTPGSGGVMRDLGTLGGTVSFGVDINDAGQVAGRSYLAGDTAVHAFRYTGTPGSGGVMIDLGTLGGTVSGGIAINNSGQVAGESYLAGETVEHAFRYDGTPGSGGVMHDLGTLGGTRSVGTAINAAGQVAGQADTTGDIGHAFRYTGTPGSGGAMADLGTLGGGNSSAFDINETGFIVGDADRAADAGGGAWATLWQIDAANTAVDLDAWLDAINPTLGAYWRLTAARGINNYGLITGQGIYDDGPGGLSDGYRAFVLDASNLVPEPATLVLLALALPLLGGRNSRRSGPGGAGGTRRFARVATTRAGAMARCDQ